MRVSRVTSILIDLNVFEKLKEQCVYDVPVSPMECTKALKPY